MPFHEVKHKQSCPKIKLWLLIPFLTKLNHFYLAVYLSINLLIQQFANPSLILSITLNSPINLGNTKYPFIIVVDP